MKSLLVLTYCYPPCTLAPSWRVAGWTRFLPRFGWRPTVICRYWGDGEAPQALTQERCVTREDRGDHEVVWVPYLPNLRDRFVRRYGLNRLTHIRQALSIGVAALERVSPAFDALRTYRRVALEELGRCHYNGVLVTGNPFLLFRVGHELRCRLGVPWAADYRDAWSTSDLNYPPGLVCRLLRAIDRNLERRWVGCAAFFTTVSPQYVDQISMLVRRPGYTILTGFGEDVEPFSAEAPFPEFTVTYLGTLYPEQPVEVFLRAVMRLVEEVGPGLRFRVRMPGIRYVERQAERVARVVEGYERHFDLLPRLPRTEALRIVARSHLLLQVGYPGAEGVVGSKVYEYMASRRPVLICPTDHGVLAEMVSGSGAGFVVRDEQEAFRLLLRLYRQYEASGSLAFEPDPARLKPYSQEEQVRALANLLDHHFVGDEGVG